MTAITDWLFNRVTVTFALIAIIVMGWNAYVDAHDDGILQGRVVDQSGAPVTGAQVILNERTIVSLAPIAETVTDADGTFTFSAHDRHALVLVAQKEGVGSSDRIEVKLYFRNQNRQLEQAIVLNNPS